MGVFEQLFGMQAPQPAANPYGRAVMNQGGGPDPAAVDRSKWVQNSAKAVHDALMISPEQAYELKLANRRREKLTEGGLYRQASAMGLKEQAEALIPEMFGAGTIKRVGGKLSDLLLSRISKDMDLPEGVVQGLHNRGSIAAPVNPVSAAGNTVGFHTPYSGSRKVKTDKLDELTGGFSKTTPEYGALPHSRIEDFEGKTFYPIGADRTSRDIIHEVGGIDVGDYANPGGFTYMRPAETGGGGGFASGHSVMSNYNRINQELGGQGVGVGTPMSGRGSDFARSGTDIAQRMGTFDNMSKPTKKMLAGEINTKIAANNAATIKAAKAKAAKEKIDYVEPSIVAPVHGGLGGDFTSRLDNEPMVRKAYMEATDLDRVAKNPEVVDAITLRHAITDDRFRYLTRGEGDPLSGFDFLELKGDLMPSSQAPSPNPSYSHHQAGDYRAPLEVPTPRSILFPDFTDRMIAEGRPTSEWNYMFDRIKPTQKVGGRSVDLYNEYKESILKGE